jgi:hypothetical protein
MAQVRGKMRSVRKAPMRLVVAQIIGEEFADRLAHILIGIASVEGEASETVIDLAGLKPSGEGAVLALEEGGELVFALHLFLLKLLDSGVDEA